MKSGSPRLVPSRRRRRLTLTIDAQPALVRRQPGFSARPKFVELHRPQLKLERRKWWCNRRRAAASCWSRRRCHEQPGTLSPLGPVGRLSHTSGREWSSPSIHLQWDRRRNASGWRLTARQETLETVDQADPGNRRRWQYCSTSQDHTNYRAADTVQVTRHFRPAAIPTCYKGATNYVDRLKPKRRSYGR